MIAAQLDKILAHFRRHPDVWFARHGELAQWAFDNDVRAPTYAARFFADKR
jgi:hypothetical protein